METLNICFDKNRKNPKGKKFKRENMINCVKYLKAAV